MRRLATASAILALLSLGVPAASAQPLSDDCALVVCVEEVLELPIDVLDGVVDTLRDTPVPPSTPDAVDDIVDGVAPPRTPQQPPDTPIPAPSPRVPQDGPTMPQERTSPPSGSDTPGGGQNASEAIVEPSEADVEIRYRTRIIYREPPESTAERVVTRLVTMPWWVYALAAGAGGAIGGGFWYRRLSIERNRRMQDNLEVLEELRSPHTES